MTGDQKDEDGVVSDVEGLDVVEELVELLLLLLLLLLPVVVVLLVVEVVVLLVVEVVVLSLEFRSIMSVMSVDRAKIERPPLLLLLLLPSSTLKIKN